MTADDATEIIKEYHHAIKDFRPDGIFQSNKQLPCVAGKIKYAHYIVGEVLIKEDKLTVPMAKILLESYGLINLLFVEDPEEGNKLYKEFIVGLKQGKINSFRIPNPYGNIDQILEYRNFLGELIFTSGKKLILSDENGLDISDAAFVYEGLYSKALKENDLKTCINLANTSLTRTVPYPGRKTNSQCVFV